MSKWYLPSSPGQIKPIPWLAPEAISYLENIITPETRVIEHGSGGSTLWFAERCKFIAAYEDDLDWCKAVSDILKGKTNVYVSPRGDPPIATTPYLSWDVMLIDGEPVNIRAEWLKWAHEFVKPSGWIVLDNANRPEYKREREGLQEFAELVHTVNSNKSAGFMYLVTEFWKVKGRIQVVSYQNDYTDICPECGTSYAYAKGSVMMGEFCGNCGKRRVK